MDSSTKILIGAMVTCAIGFAGHSMGSVGSSFVDNLEEQAISSISESGLEGVNVTFTREPSIKRVAVLNGDVSEENQKKALQLVRDIPGVSNAYWETEVASVDDGGQQGVSTNTTTASSESASLEEVSKCQDNINGIMEGKNINFRSGSYYVQPTSFPILDKIVKTLKPCSGVSIEIQGHTDLIGSEIINQNISEARANSVKVALIERGLDANMLIAKGYGASQPIENARTTTANAKNRRTIFVVSAIKN